MTLDKTTIRIVYTRANPIWLRDFAVWENTVKNSTQLARFNVILIQSFVSFMEKKLLNFSFTNRRG